MRGCPRINGASIPVSALGREQPLLIPLSTDGGRGGGIQLVGA
jgi:hypothetical protein